MYIPPDAKFDVNGDPIGTGDVVDEYGYARPGDAKQTTVQNPGGSYDYTEWKQKRNKNIAVIAVFSAVTIVFIVFMVIIVVQSEPTTTTQTIVAAVSGVVMVGMGGVFIVPLVSQWWANRSK